MLTPTPLLYLSAHGLTSRSKPRSAAQRAVGAEVTGPMKGAVGALAGEDSEGRAGPEGHMGVPSLASLSACVALPRVRLQPGDPESGPSLFSIRGRAWE